jgi:hypothetical protein
MKCTALIKLALIIFFLGSHTAQANIQNIECSMYKPCPTIVYGDDGGGGETPKGGNGGKPPSGG